MPWPTSANPPTPWPCSAEAASTPSLPPLMRCWLTAARAEMHAHLGDRDAARRGFDKAEYLLPADSDDPTMPYLSLNITHLVPVARPRPGAAGRTRSHRLPHRSAR